MTATTLLQMAERVGVRVGFSPSGGLKASGPRDALAKWLPELRAMKPAIAAAVAATPALCRATIRLLAQGHEHDIVEVAAKPLAQPVRRAFT